MTQTIISVKTQKPVRITKDSKKKGVAKATAHELFQWIALQDGSFYDQVALKLRQLGERSKNGNGKSEKAIRYSLGLPYDDSSLPGSSSSEDIPDVGEVKDIVKKNKNGSFELEGLRVQQHARNIWANLKESLVQEAQYCELTLDQKRRIERGEITSKMIHQLPSDIARLMLTALKASNTCRWHKNMFLGGFECFLKVPRNDYDKAFTFSGVTLGGTVKYRVRRDYLESRVLAIIALPNFVERTHKRATSIDDINVSVTHAPQHVTQHAIDDVSITYNETLISGKMFSNIIKFCNGVFSALR